MLCACVTVCGAVGEKKCLKSPHFIHTIFFLWHHEVISRCFFCGALSQVRYININVGDAALVVFCFSIAHDYCLLNIKYVCSPRSALLCYWHGVQILYSADYEHAVYRTD